MATECKHGQLARSCEICELEAENERLRAERDRDAIAGQAALDEANNEIVRLREAVRKAVMWSELNDEQLSEIEQLSGFTFEQLVRDACERVFQRQAALDAAGEDK